MHVVLVIVQYVLVGCTPALNLLFVFLLFKLLKIDKIHQAVTQSSALFGGFILCIFVFGVVILPTELFACWNTHIPNFAVFLKFKCYYILTVLFVTVLFLTLYGVYCSCIGPARGHKFMLCKIMLLMLIVIICCFAVHWAIISSFATLLLSFAYPVHVTTLVVLHFTLVFAISITFGVFVSEYTTNWKLCTCKCTCACILFTLVIAIPLYIAFIGGYAFTIVQRIVPAGGVIQGLLLLPSVILFLISWLLKKRFFGM